MKEFKVGVLGATGMVGQRFVSLLEGHPWFKVTCLAASARSAGKTYEQALAGRWAMPTPCPASARDMVVMDAVADMQAIASQVDFVFCAVDMSKEETRQLEEGYARAECPVVSNNSAHRFTPDVPMLLPELNPQHAQIIPAQRRRLGTRRGFIAVKPNCSLQSYLSALVPLAEFGITKVLACTYQAISGAGKTFDTWPEMRDNVIPFISGEEEKSEKEPMKILGQIEGDEIAPAQTPDITTQCIRVPVSDGHLAAVFVSFASKPSMQEIKQRWADFSGEPQRLGLPMAPRPFLTYFEEENRPQTGLDRMLQGGMGIGIGRLRPDTQYDYKFVCLSHNTIRGAAGGAILMAELLAAQGYLD